MGCFGPVAFSPRSLTHPDAAAGVSADTVAVLVLQVPGTEEFTASIAVSVSAAV